MVTRTAEQKVLHVCVVVTLAVMAVGQLATAQVTTDWPVRNATAEQSRFANIDALVPPQGILWRAPHPSGNYIQTPVVSNGKLFLGWEVLDSANGKLLYEFPEGFDVLAAAQAVGEVEVQDASENLSTHTFLFRAKSSTIYAYDIADMPPDPSGVWQPVWSRTHPLSGSILVPSFNFLDGYLYLSPNGYGTGLVKIDGATGDEVWRVEVAGNGHAAVGDVDFGDGNVKRLVISGSRAFDDEDGADVWQLEYNAGHPTLLPDPVNKVVATIHYTYVVGKGKKGRISTYCVACFDAVTGEEIWKQDIGDEYPWNGPVAIRYEYDELTGQPSKITIYATTGGSDDQTPVYAFDIEANDAWPDNPIVLPVSTYAVPTATKDLLFVALHDGNIYSFNAFSGDYSVGDFEVRGSSNDGQIAIASDDGSYVLYTHSDRLGFMALVPYETYNMSVMNLSVAERVDLGSLPTTVEVTVENTGSCLESNVTTELCVDGNPVAFWTRDYTAYGTENSSETFPYEWNPTPGTYELEARIVTVIDGEVGKFDNAMYRTVQVLEADVVTLTSAYWVQNKKRLYVKATSSQQPEAVLWVQYEGVGPTYQMSFDSKNDYYTYLAREPVPPDFVVVTSDMGGSDSREVGIRAR